MSQQPAAGTARRATAECDGGGGVVMTPWFACPEDTWARTVEMTLAYTRLRGVRRQLVEI